MLSRASQRGQSPWTTSTAERVRSRESRIPAVRSSTVAGGRSTTTRSTSTRAAVTSSQCSPGSGTSTVRDRSIAELRRGLGPEVGAAGEADPLPGLRGPGDQGERQRRGVDGVGRPACSGHQVGESRTGSGRDLPGRPALHRGDPLAQLLDHRSARVERGDGAGGRHVPMIEHVFERVKRSTTRCRPAGGPSDHDRHVVVRRGPMRGTERVGSAYADRTCSTERWGSCRRSRGSWGA